MRTVIKYGLPVSALLLSLLAANTASAVEGNRYRAELVLIERIDSAQNIDERMQSRHPSTPEDIGKTLLARTDSGQAYSDLDLVPPGELYLSGAARRLKNSGRFRILMQAGWYQSFPPNYQGERLRIALGDLLPTTEPGQKQRAIEGFVRINRQRYLHVAAKINHWEKVAKEKTEQAPGSAPTPENPDGEKPASTGKEQGETPSASGATKSVTGDTTDGAGADPTGAAMGGQTPRSRIQLLTWLHETRRMRSEEIHYLGSPTIGLLVYFAPVEEKPDASPPDQNDSSASQESEENTGKVGEPTGQ